MEKVNAISKAISTVSGVVILVGALVYCNKVRKCFSNYSKEEKNQVKK